LPDIEKDKPCKSVSTIDYICIKRENKKDKFMSVTFYINNNDKYVDENCPEKIIKETDDCQCVDFSDNGKPVSTCFTCKGKGTISITYYPYEMNIANGNFYTLMNALGLDDECYGEIDPRTLLKAINRTPTSLIERHTTQSGGNGKVTMISCGIAPEQAQGYIDTLKEIAIEAEKREEKIYWC